MRSMIPTLVPSTATPSTVTPSSLSPTSVQGDIITTIAGTGTGSYSGDEAAATSATLYYPSGVVLDSSGIPYYLLTSLIFKYL